MKLTNITCKNALPRKKAYKLSDGGGLYLEVYPNGNRHWRMKYRINGKENRISLGAYPEVPLIEAREKWQQERKQIKNGLDPSSARQEKKRLAEFQVSQTFELIAREWYAIRYSRWSANHAKSILQRLEADVFPQIGNVPISKLNAPLLLTCLRKIEDRNAHEMAKRALQICGQVMSYAVQTARVERSFIPYMKGALVGHTSVPYAAIESDELPKLLKDIENNKARLYRQTVLALKLMMLTFVRTGELINATWDEFDFERLEWVIPAERMKMRRVHIVPLSNQSVTILEELKKLNGKRDYVFPHVSKPRKPMSNNTILMALKRMGYKGKMTGHGFRALAMSTIKEKLGYRHEVIDRQLAHVPGNKVDRAYDRAQFLPERHKMMQAWADYIDCLRKIDVAKLSRNFDQLDC